MEEGDAVERHDQDPDPGQDVGQVPVPRRTDHVAHRRGSATRSAPTLSITVAGTRSPTEYGPPTRRLLPSTSGPWWSARPSGPSSFDSTSTTTSCPMRSA